MSRKLQSVPLAQKSKTWSQADLDWSTWDYFEGVLSSLILEDDPDYYDDNEAHEGGEDFTGSWVSFFPD
jgi:hypothetical protein